MMLVVQIQHAMLYNAQKTNMFLIILVTHVAGTYNAAGDSASGPDTVCDSVICNENYRVSDHECVICAPGTYNSSGDDAVDPILYVIR